MKQEIKPQETTRARAYELWMKSPMPMVTVTKTFDVTHLVKISKRKGYKFNMLLCWCIGKAASRVNEFYTLPIKGKLYQYDRLAVNIIIKNNKGDLSFCDIYCNDDLESFHADYQRVTQITRETCQDLCVDDAMQIGTSALVSEELDVIVNQYNELFCNPMTIWGKYRKGWFRTTLPVSFQFHHVQMDGEHAAHFLKELQKTIYSV